MRVVCEREGQKGDRTNTPGALLTEASSSGRRLVRREALQVRRADRDLAAETNALLSAAKELWTRGQRV